jgi:hypothetical protein
MDKGFIQIYSRKLLLYWKASLATIPFWMPTNEQRSRPLVCSYQNAL